MPKPGAERPAAAIAAIGSEIYSPVAHRAAEHPGPVVPLHVGDTWMAPPASGRMEALREDELPGLHRYGPTAGLPALREALAARSGARWQVPRPIDEVLVVAGATSGLACAVSAIVDPGDEVLIAAPFWPLIRGIVHAQRGVPVEVPFHGTVASADDAVAALEAARTERTVAAYLNTPSNPSARVVPASWLEAIAEWAARHDLWLLSDEVYSEFVYAGEHLSLATIAPERTIVAQSFSKTWGVAGNRIGALLGPAPVLAEAHKVSVHSAYHAPTAAQHGALRLLTEPDAAAWVDAARTAYGAAGDDAAKVLGLPAPEGSCFLFVDVAPVLGEGGILGFLEACLERGVLVAPGSSSGSAYATHVRICFTSAPPADVAQAVRALAELIPTRVD